MPQQPEDVLINHLHNAAFDPAGWQGFGLELERQFGGAKASLHGIADELYPPLLTVAGSFEPEFALSYFAHYHAINPFMRLSAVLPEAQPRVSTMDISDEFLHSTVFYQEWLRPQEDLAYAVAIKSRSYENRSVVLSLNLRRRRGEMFALRAQHLLTRLEPHLSHAFRTAEIISMLRVKDGLVGRSRHYNGGLIMLDDRLRLVWAEPGVIMQEGHLFRLDPLQRIVFNDATVQEWIEDTLKPSRGAKQGPAAVLSSNKWQISYVSAAESLTMPSPFFSSGSETRPRSLFLLFKCDEVLSREARLKLNYTLTDAEAQIALAIVQGLSTSEIALARQVSRHTVRNQVRAVFSKMEARNRVDVVRNLLSLQELE